MTIVVTIQSPKQEVDIKKHTNEVATTTWLQPLGYVDQNNVPIASTSQAERTVTTTYDALGRKHKSPINSR